MQERILITHHLSYILIYQRMVTQKLIESLENFADEEEDHYVTTIRFSEAMSLLMKYLKFLM